MPCIDRILGPLPMTLRVVKALLETTCEGHKDSEYKVFVQLQTSKVLQTFLDNYKENIMTKPEFKELMELQYKAAQENCEMMSRVAGADAGHKIWFLVYRCTYQFHTRDRNIDQFKS